MALNLESKKAIVAEVTEVAKNALSAIAVEYRGMSVNEMTELRVKAREMGVYLRVVRNTLAIRAVADTEFNCLNDVLVGPLVLAFAQQDPGAAARLLRDFSKKNEKLQVKGIAISGQLLPANALESVANLPTRDEAIAQLMSVMNAPITKFVRTLAEPHAQLVRCFAAVGRQKEAA